MALHGSSHDVYSLLRKVLVESHGAFMGYSMVPLLRALMGIPPSFPWGSNAPLDILPNFREFPWCIPHVVIWYFQIEHPMGLERLIMGPSVGYLSGHTFPTGISHRIP